MTQNTTHRRARLDALLDQGGLEHASAADRAWLAAERGRDPSFDHEVAALLRAEAHLREWGSRAGRTGQMAEEALDGILAGLDAGLYDDDLELDAPPRFDDGDGEVVALGAARPVAVASDAAAAAVVAAAAGAAPAPPRSLGGRVVRDGRFMQVLAAAAALVLVVTAGLSMVSVSSSPDASESAAAVQAPSPAPPAAVAPPMAAPAEASRFAEEAPMAEAEFYDQQAPQEPAAPTAAPRDGRMALGNGYGGGHGSPESATGASAGSVPAGATARTQASSPPALELMAQPEAPPAPVVSPSFASDIPASEDAMTRGVARRPGASSTAGDIRPAPRYTTQSAMQQAMNQCITAPRVVTYQVAARTGVVQVLEAPGASETELSCLRGVAARTTVTPAPGVARRQQVTLRTVPDRSAQ